MTADDAPIFEPGDVVYGDDPFRGRRRPDACDRHLGVNALRLSRGIGSGSMGGQAVLVYYLDEHRRIDVSRAFLDMIPGVIDA